MDDALYGILVILGITLAFVLFIQLAAPPEALYSPSHTLYAGKDGLSLAAAIEAAKPGNTIIVMPGSYRENLTINKPLRIISWEEVMAAVGRPLPPGVKITVQGRDPETPVFKIVANNVRLSGLIIEGGSVGVELTQAKGCKILDNEIRFSKSGIIVSNAQGNLVRGNKIETVSTTGIALIGSSNNKVRDNAIEGGEAGLRLSNAQENEIEGNEIRNAAVAALLQASSRNKLVRNRLSGREQGLVLEDSPENSLRENMLSGSPNPIRVIGDAAEDWVQQIDTSNTIDRQPIYYLVGATDKTIDARADPGHLVLVRCRRITITGLNLSNGGILLIETEEATIQRNRISGAGEGIELWRTKNTLLQGNIISGSDVGIGLHESSAAILSQNVITASGSGIVISGGGGHLLEENEVSGSTRYGITIEASTGNRLTANRVSGSKEHGILIKSGSGNYVVENRLVQSWVGIFLDGTTANVISRNEVQESKFGIYLSKSLDNEISGNRLSKNSVALGGALEGNKIVDNSEE